MTGFSQPERRGLERLQRRYPAQAHPDADLLTAFTEQTATGREREQVLAHLAVCSACREVVSFAATPVEESGITPVVAKKKTPVWEWPFLRWGTLAASLAVVVIAVYVGTNEKRAAVSPMTSETAPLSQPATAHEQRDAAVQPPASSGLKAPQIRYEKVLPKTSEPPAKKKASNAAPQNGDIPVGYKAEAAPKLDQSLAFESKLKDSREAQNLTAGAVGEIVGSGNGRRDKISVLNKKTDSLGSLQSPATRNEVSAMAKPAVVPAPPPPPPPPLVARTAAAPAAAETVNVTGQAVATEATTVSSEHDSALAETTAQKSMTVVGGARKDENRALPAGRAMLSNNYNTQWLVTPEGYLLNSNDSGKNWARQLPDQRFTHVQTVSNQVWASGSDGSLMHSTDGGVNWTRVIPSDKDTKMTGYITSIVFVDASHGTLKTSTNETWSTTDTGKTWKKQ